MSLNMFCRNREISMSFRVLRVEGKPSKCGIGRQRRRRSGGARVGGRSLSLDDSSFSFNFLLATVSSETMFLERSNLQDLNLFGHL